MTFFFFLTDSVFFMSLHFYLAKNITCSSPCHHPLVFFFKININCPGARLSCSAPEAAYAEVTCAISERKKQKCGSKTTADKHQSVFKSLFYIPGFLFNVPDLPAFPKFYKEKIHFKNYYFQQSRHDNLGLLRIKDF